MKALDTSATALQPVKNDFIPLDNGNLSGSLLDGIRVGDDLLIEFELRPCRAADMFDAEKDASPERYLAYRGALIGRQLVRLGDLNGPIAFDLIGKLTPRDLMRLVDAMNAVEVTAKKA